jgi:hypothetical protein
LIFKSLKQIIQLSTKEGEMSSLPFVVRKGTKWYIRWFQYAIEGQNDLRIKSIHTMDMITGGRTHKVVSGLLFIIEDSTMWPDYNNPKNDKYYEDLELAFILRNKIQIRNLLNKETNIQSIQIYDLMRDWT